MNVFRIYQGFLMSLPILMILIPKSFQRGEKKEFCPFLQVFEGEADKDADMHTCPVCSKSFLCKYGLESHMDDHHKMSLKCQECNLTFRNTRGLNMHKLMVHNRNRSSSESSNPEQRKNGLKINSVPVGFQDLSFADFSTEKFPLIAKSWCEKNVRRSSSSYHNFVCNACDMAFPSRSALSLHIKTHKPSTTSRCKECDSSLINKEALDAHMLTHIADKVISANTTRSPVHKEDFLALFQLKSSKQDGDSSDNHQGETSVVEDDSADLQREDRKQNDHYFARLGQMLQQTHPMLAANPELLSLQLAKAAAFSANHNHKKIYVDENDNENKHDFADIQQILRVTSGVEGAYPGVLPPPVTLMSLTAADQNNLLKKQMPTLQRMLPISPRTPTLHKQPPPLRYNPTSTSNPSMPGTPVNHHTTTTTTTMPNGLLPTAASHPAAREHATNAKHTDLFKCKYCSDAFSNFRALKGELCFMIQHVNLKTYNQCLFINLSLLSAPLTRML